MQKNKPVKKPWPKNCPWPEPAIDTYSDDWAEDWIDPDTLDEDAAELLEIKEYFDSLVEEGLLDEDYRLNEDYFDDTEEDPAEWAPEKGECYWDDGCFDLDFWGEEFAAAVSLLKIGFGGDDPAGQVSNAIGYEFVNENLLRQAFTRRAFALEYGLSGCSEELEFLGDAVLNHVISKELIRQLSDVDKEQVDAPFRMDEGVAEGMLSRLRSQYVCKEQLAARLQDLGLDNLILYGTGETPSESRREDALEALVGAVAIDSGWNQDVIDGVVDKLICVQKEKLYSRAESSYYDRFNAWHQKHFGVMPEYAVSGMAPKYYCTMRYFIPENDQDLWRDRREDTDADSRSAAREWAARMAYEFVVCHGLWISIDSSAVTPQLENSINQLQELYQKKYLDAPPAYEFVQLSAEEWKCECNCGGMFTIGIDVGKTNAKKLAAFDMLNRLLQEGPRQNNKHSGEFDWEMYNEAQYRANNLRALRELSTRKHNWDGDGALPFSKELIANIMSVIRILDHQPNIAPLGEGNIQLEFGTRRSGHYLEFVLHQSGLIACRSGIDGQEKTSDCELTEIPTIVSEWLKQQEPALENTNA